MGIKITTQLVVRIACVIIVIGTLFFDYLYIDKVISNWWMFSDNPSLINLTLLGLVGYCSINLLIALGVKWFWS